jgi:hypothetical protein
MRHFCLGLMLMMAVAGCGTITGPNQEYIAPAVTGRVVNAKTSQPVAGARVIRYPGNPPPRDPFPKKGGEQLMAPAPVVTDAEGRFYIPAEKSAHLLITPAGTLLLTVVAQHMDYSAARTNLDLLVIKPVHTPKGPEISAGELRLLPKSD